MAPRADRSVKAVAVVLAAAMLSIGAGLGAATLWEPDEPRFSEATRQMFARGDFLTPYFNGAPRFEKPILLYWLQAAAFAAVGPNELASRIPSALSGIGCVLLLYLIGARLASTQAAMVAAVALATMFRFVALSRQGLTDIPVVFFIVAALYGFVRATEPRPLRGAAWLGWIAVGLGLLTKGPVGLLPLPIWAAYALAAREAALVTRIHPFAGPLVALLIAAPWYLDMIAQHGRAFVDFAFGHEIVARVLSEDTFADRRGFFYYFKVWPGDAAPWSLLFVAAVAWAAWHWRRLDRAVRRPLVFGLSWCATVFFLFSLSRSKVTHYVLPAYPAAALTIGVFVDQVARRASEVAWWRIPTTIIALAIFAAAVLLARSIDVLMPAAGAAATWLVPVILGAGAVLIAAFTWRGAAIRAVLALGATLALAFAAIGLVIVPQAVEAYKPMPRLARAAERLAPPEARIGLLGRYGASSLVYYSHHNVEWLTGDDAAIAFLTTRPHALCVMPAADYARLAPRLPGVRVVDEAEEFNVRIERLRDRQRTPGRRWVLLSR
jgi:4-amino-4-deoxy-L-arabinose transferase-like glycosyltransferase